MSLTVQAVGALALVQDTGRFGHARLGISESGAADQASHALANRIVGNAPGAATIEVLLGGLALACSAPCTVAVTGAPAPVLVNRRPAAFSSPIALRPGDVLSLAAPTAGLRTYVAVRGGVDVRPVLGSRSTDATTGVGPRPLAVGDVLPVGGLTGVQVADVDVPGPLVSAGDGLLTGTWGPREEWLDDAGHRVLTQTAWAVSSQADRVGIRLDGPRLSRARDGEPLSEGVVRGAVQVPPDGQPVVFLADHPTTGGYPVVAVVDDVGLSQLAQARPGTRIRFSLRRVQL